MKNKNLLIGELAKLADVTVRTIRYYLNEGLLQEPEKKGRYAYFSEEHLERLALIRRLKDLRLPLEEIRLILETADDSDIQELVNIQEKTEPDQIKPHPLKISDQPGDAALNYIAHIANARDIVEKVDRSESRQGSLFSKNQLENSRFKQSIEPETWQRISLSKGVELNFRKSGDPDQQEKIELLVQFARKLFGQKKGG